MDEVDDIVNGKMRRQEVDSQKIDCRRLRLHYEPISNEHQKEVEVACAFAVTANTDFGSYHLRIFVGSISSHSRSIVVVVEALLCRML